MGLFGKSKRRSKSKSAASTSQPPPSDRPDYGRDSDEVDPTNTYYDKYFDTNTFTWQSYGPPAPPSPPRPEADWSSGGRRGYSYNHNNYADHYGNRGYISDRESGYGPYQSASHENYHHHTPPDMTYGYVDNAPPPPPPPRTSFIPPPGYTLEEDPYATCIIM